MTTGRRVRVSRPNSKTVVSPLDMTRSTSKRPPTELATVKGIAGFGESGKVVLRKARPSAVNGVQTGGAGVEIGSRGLMRSPGMRSEPGGKVGEHEARSRDGR